MKKSTRFILVLSIMLLFVSCFPDSCNSYSELIRTWPKTSIETAYFDIIKLDVEDASESYVLEKSEYDNSIYDLCVEIIDGDLPVEFEYDGVLKMQLFDEKNNLLESHTLNTIQSAIYSEDSLSNFKFIILHRGRFKIEGESIKVVLTVEKADPQFQSYEHRCFLGPVMAP